MCRRFLILFIYIPKRFLNPFLEARLKFMYHNMQECENLKWNIQSITEHDFQPLRCMTSILYRDFPPSPARGILHSTGAWSLYWPTDWTILTVLNLLFFSVSGKFTVSGPPTGVTWMSSRPGGWSKLILLLCITQVYSKRNVTVLQWLGI